MNYFFILKASKVVSKKGCIFQGNDISQTPTNDAKVCAKKCETTSECTHFTWYGGTCCIKRGDASMSNAEKSSIPGAVCGVKQ